MSRLPTTQSGLLNEDQQELFDRILGTRPLRSDGDIGGPFDAWILNAELLKRCMGMGLMFEHRMSFERKFVKLVILIVAREWRANYPWFVHSRYALEEGLPESVIKAIHEGREPDFEDAMERVCYDYIRELLDTRQISDETYAKTLGHFGEVGLAELANLAGFYCMVAMTLNTFRIPPPEAAEVFPFPDQEIR